MNHTQRCLQAKVENWNEPKKVMPKSQDLSRSLEINAIWTFDTEFPTIFNKSCTYHFIDCSKHRQLRYGSPRGQTSFKWKNCDRQWHILVRYRPQTGRWALSKDTTMWYV